MRVDGLEDEQAAGHQRSAGELEEPFEGVVRQVLDDVDRGDRAEAAGRLSLEVGDRVGLLDLQALRAAALDHRLVGVDAASLDSRVPQ